MPKIRFHKLVALIVLVCFAAWVATGRFSSVGSASTEAEKKSAAAVEQPKAPVRTVAVVTPPRVQHARAIRMSGQTEANQRATLAVRNNGVIDQLPVKQGDHVKAGDLILKLAAEEKLAAIATARQVLEQREAEATAAEVSFRFPPAVAGAALNHSVRNPFGAGPPVAQSISSTV